MITAKNAITLIALNLSIFGFSQGTTNNTPAELISHIGGESKDLPNSIVADDFGNVISSGVFTAPITVNVMEKDEHDENTVKTPLTLTPKGMGDGIITKYNYEDKLVWATQLSATKFVNPEVISVNIGGNVFVAGVFQGDFTYSVDGEEKILTSKGPDGDAFILKIDNNGNIEWVRQFGGSESRLSFSEMKTGSSSSILLTGKFLGRTNFNSSKNWAESHPNNLFSGGGGESRAINGFLLKLNYVGDVKWVKQVYSEDYAISSSLVIDNDENIYISGEFSGIVSFSDLDNRKSITGVDSYIAKYDAGGGFLWAKYYRLDGEVKINSLALNSNNQVIACGDFKSKKQVVVGDDGDETFFTSFNKMKTNGTTDGFVLCINSKGELEWTNHIENDLDVFVPTIDCTADDNIVVTGYVNHASQRNLYIRELNATGDQLNDYTIQGGFIKPVKAFYSNQREATYIVGEFKEKLIINAKEYKSNGNSDIFILKVE